MAVDLVHALIRTQASADGLAERLMEIVKTELLVGRTSFPPRVLVHYRHRPDGPDCYRLYLLGVPFTEDYEKRVTLNRLGKLVYQSKHMPIGVGLESEAWHTKHRPGTPHLEPRHDPARREVIMVAATTMYNVKTASTHMEITRGAECSQCKGRGQILVGQQERQALRPCGECRNTKVLAVGSIVPGEFRLPLCTDGRFALLLHFWNGFAGACPGFMQRN